MKEIKEWFKALEGRPLAIRDGAENEPAVVMDAGVSDAGVLWWIALSPYDLEHAKTIETWKVHNKFCLEINDGFFVGPAAEFPELDRLNAETLVRESREKRDPQFLETYRAECNAKTP